MNDSERKKLAEALVGLSEYYAKPLGQAETKIYFRALAGYRFDDIDTAIGRHLEDPDRGRFFPKVADLVAKLPGRKNGHLGPDEAWAIALESFDEESTVVWTRQIAAARSAAQPIWDSGDQVGARMAFRSAYERELRDAPPSPQWEPSLGHDPARRADALRDAVDRGLLTAEQAQRHLPPGSMSADGAAIAGMITGTVASIEPSPETKSRLSEIRRMLEAQEARAKREREERERQAMAERRAAEQRRQELLAQAGVGEVGEHERRDDSDYAAA